SPPSKQPREKKHRDAAGEQRPLDVTRPVGNRQEDFLARSLDLHSQRTAPDETAAAAGENQAERLRDRDQSPPAVPRRRPAIRLDPKHAPTLSLPKRFSLTRVQSEGYGRTAAAGSMPIKGIFWPGIMNRDIHVLRGQSTRDLTLTLRVTSDDDD